MLDRRTRPAHRLVRQIVTAGRRGQRLILLGSAGFNARYADLVAATLLARSRRPPHIVISDATWELGSASLARFLPVGRALAGSTLERVSRAAVQALDGSHVTYCVLSSEELRTFPETWGVPAERVVFTPYCFSLRGADLDPPRDADGGVFAGGNPLRDYATLARAVEPLDRQVVMATKAIPEEDRRDLPRNVRAGPLPPSRFRRELRRSRAVAVPFRPGTKRSAGQQTYLNAMALGKPVVVTDGPGVRDYIEDGVTGLIVPPKDPPALRAGLERALDPEEGPAIGARARSVALERFSFERYLRSLLRIAETRPGQLATA
jgi:hypothetical protein